MEKEWFLHRSYKLYELDGTNCKLVTGMDYEELRDYAAFISGGMSAMWNAILSQDAETTWRQRQQLFD